MTKNGHKSPAHENRKYDFPITSPDHVRWCLAFAAQRYGERVVIEQGMPLVEDADGVCHTDAILRSLGNHWPDVVKEYIRSQEGGEPTSWVIVAKGMVAAYGVFSSEQEANEFATEELDLSVGLFELIPLQLVEPPVPQQ
jgi:hypothetical protein